MLCELFLTRRADKGQFNFLRENCIPADSKGITVKQLFVDAIEETVRRNVGKQEDPAEPAWVKLAGAFGRTSDARAETRRIQKVIDAEFERIEPEDR